jgi:hypothetical protein
MLVTLLVLSPFAAIGLALWLPASRRRSRVAAGGPAAAPPAHRTGRGAAVPVITDMPEREGREPFSYDNGLMVGDREGP